MYADGRALGATGINKRGTPGRLPNGLVERRSQDVHANKRINTKFQSGMASSIATTKALKALDVSRFPAQKNM
jgi:hypothetical protein